MVLPPDPSVLTRYGGWIPSDHVYSAFHDRLASLAATYSKSKLEHEPAVQAFADAINKGGDDEKKSLMRTLFDEIFLQAAKEYNFWKITNFVDLLYALDHVINNPPKFEVVKDQLGNEVGEPVGVPIYLLLDIPSNTAAAYDLFRMPEFNKAMKALLDAWGKYLKTGDSKKSLNTKETGWFSDAGMAKLRSQDRIPDGKDGFIKTYVTVHNSNDPNQGFGYRSWDEFFVRQFQPNARPLHIPDNPELAAGLIHSACESTVFRISLNVKKHDQFWLKGQRYSLYDMIGRDSDPKHKKLADQFVGGIVYQAFLSPQDYHRWHAPVNGKIIDSYVLQGTYYAVIPDAGAEIGDPDLKLGDPRGALIRSQPFLSIAATRAVIFIEADNKDIGLMCFVGIGMCEVSTCELTVKNNAHVKVGDELGMFHFGGSSHVLMFNNEASKFISFDSGVVPDKHIQIHTPIAFASKDPHT